MDATHVCNLYNGYHETISFLVIIIILKMYIMFEELSAALDFQQ